MWTGGPEETGEVNVDSEEQSGLERGMLTGETERVGDWNFDWRNRSDWRTVC